MQDLKAAHNTTVKALALPPQAAPQLILECACMLIQAQCLRSPASQMLPPQLPLQTPFIQRDHQKSLLTLTQLQNHTSLASIQYRRHKLQTLSPSLRGFRYGAAKRSRCRLRRSERTRAGSCAHFRMRTVDWTRSLSSSCCLLFCNWQRNLCMACSSSSSCGGEPASTSSRQGEPQ